MIVPALPVVDGGDGLLPEVCRLAVGAAGRTGSAGDPRVRQTWAGAARTSLSAHPAVTGRPTVKRDLGSPDPSSMQVTRPL